jgi:aminopeptidase N
MLCLMALGMSAQQLEKGVSKELAQQRKSNISNVVYNLTFNIPADVKTPITGKAVISFDLKQKADVVLDFQGGFSGTCTINNKKKRPASYKKEHIVLPEKSMKDGTNIVEIDFASLDKALNRQQDYLYTLFMPDQAHTVFPCFDQPDLKAQFSTTLALPEGWKSIVSDCSKPLPTYLYSFVAGKFQEKTGSFSNRPIRILYRETDPAKVAQLDRVVDYFSQSLKWMEGYTAMRPPFKEYGMAILPDYPFGGMENPGAFQLSDRRIFLEKNASMDDQLKRMELIAHETAHLWFGDIVQMDWFNNLWIKEVFANFMASKITRQQFKRNEHEMNFISTYQTRAIAIDRTDGTHPIEQQNTDLNHESLLYDNIIYDKATVMMRMLEQTMGATAMQNGLRQLLQEYYLKDATWDDIVTILDKEAPAAGVRQFCEVWVKQKGMPIINTTYKDGQLIVSQNDPYQRGLFWRQKFVIQTVNDLKPSRTIVVDMEQPTMTFKLADKPSFIIPNYTGQGYGRFTMDDEYIELLPKRLITTRNELARYSMLLTIHDNYLMGKVAPSHFGELYRFMMKEKNTTVMATAIDNMFKIAFDMPSDGQRKTLELCMMDLLGENKSSECRQLMYRKMAKHATSPDVLAQMERVWQAQTDPMFTDHDYMEMAYRLAITHPDRWQSILSSERSRLQSPDLQKEFDFVSRACNPDANARNSLFKELLKKDKRQEESWAIHAISLLSTDVFEPQNNSLISTSLTNLKFLQQTSDITFPGEWIKAVLENHKSTEAKMIVEKFLAENKDLPEDLRSKVLEASWTLLNQVPYVEKPKPVVTSKPKTTAKKKATAKKKK